MDERCVLVLDAEPGHTPSMIGSSIEPGTAGTLPAGVFFGQKRVALARPGWTAYLASYPAFLRCARHDHERAALCFVSSGVYREQAGRAWSDVGPGCIVQHPAGNHHANEHGPAPVAILIAEFDAAYVDQFVHAPTVLRERIAWRDSATASLSKRLHGELRTPDAATPIACDALLLECLARLARQQKLPKDRAPAWLACVEEQLRASTELTPSLAALAQSVQLHPSHLARAFRQHRGMSIGSYKRLAMVEAARDRLIASNDSIASIAHQIGFADQSHMARVFKTVLGRSPSSFRPRP